MTAPNYGKRLLFDVMVPEPAAFLLDAMIVHQAEGVELVKPDPFTLTPDQLTPANYSWYVSKYQATSVDPPPLEFITVCSSRFNDYLVGEDLGQPVAEDIGHVPLNLCWIHQKPGKVLEIQRERLRLKFFNQAPAP